jgi:hypothetical protein
LHAGIQKFCLSLWRKALGITGGSTRTIMLRIIAG